MSESRERCERGLKFYQRLRNLEGSAGCQCAHEGCAGEDLGDPNADNNYGEEAIERLATFLEANYQEEMGSLGLPEPAAAVDKAIELLTFDDDLIQSRLTEIHAAVQAWMEVPTTDVPSQCRMAAAALLLASMVQESLPVRAAADRYRRLVEERDALLKDQHDLQFIAGEVSKVYMHITDGKLSKPNYYAATVIAEADDACNRAIEAAVQELEAATDAQYVREAQYERQIEELREQVADLHEQLAVQKDVKVAEEQLERPQYGWTKLRPVGWTEQHQSPTSTIEHYYHAGKRHGWVDTEHAGGFQTFVRPDFSPLADSDDSIRWCKLSGEFATRDDAKIAVEDALGYFVPVET
jgi:hypothetical protein